MRRYKGVKLIHVVVKDLRFPNMVCRVQTIAAEHARELIRNGRVLYTSNNKASADAVADKINLMAVAAEAR